MTVFRDDPIGFFLTWVTYGTWLPGDSRGWVEYRHGWQLPRPFREAEAKAKMTDDACRLTAEQRAAVCQQIAETCDRRDWCLRAVNCRSNHVHVVVSTSDVHPKNIRDDLKVWTTRRLRAGFESTREKWWAERGSTRYLTDEKSLNAAVAYVLDGQERKPQDDRTW